jgi:heparosan-N-sulfate-glucuronate 5-epimerase
MSAVDGRRRRRASEDGRRRYGRGFSLPPGRHVRLGAVGGYYLDFTEKTEDPQWPPPWFPWPGFHRFMAIPQWGLGAYERYLDGQGSEWLASALRAAAYLVEEQTADGRYAGGWFEPHDYPHTFNIRGPWLSAMAQGQCASLLVRAHAETKDERFADAARHALKPMTIATHDGGVQATLDGDAFPEEYPTTPPAFVLNGAIFALWGYYDLWKGTSDDKAGALFRNGTSALTANLHRWDTGYWSRYDLFPHPIINVASPAYHRLHIHQLQILADLAENSDLRKFAERFESYAESRRCRIRALAMKVAFRLAVPRNNAFARRLPWTRSSARSSTSDVPS